MPQSPTEIGEIQWRRPEAGARADAQERWFGAADRPGFFELFVPLVVLAVGSILAIGVVAAALVGILSLLI